MKENATMSTDELIDRVVDGLIEEKGLDKIDNKTELKERLSEELTKRVNMAVLEKLPDDKFDEFEKMAKEDNAEYNKLQDLVASSDVDFTETIKEAIERFRQAFLDIDIKAKGKAEA